MRRALWVTLSAFTLIATSCTTDDQTTATDTADPSPTRSADPTSSASPEQQTGVLIDRPLYTVRIPKGFSDVGDKAMIEQDENSLRSRDDDAGISYPTVNLTFHPDSPWDDIEETSGLIMEQAHDINPRIKRVADTTFAGEKAIHTVGPGFDSGSWLQGFHFLHDGSVVVVRINSPRGKAATQKIVDLVRSTWEWK